MKKVFLILFEIIFCFYVKGQVVAQVSETKGVGKNPVTNNSGRVKVNITWLGPGNAKLSFNNEEYAVTAGQHLTSNFTSAFPYVLKVKTSDNKILVYNEFVTFDGGDRNLNIKLINDKIVITNPEKVINRIIANMVLVQGGSFIMGCANVPGSTCFDFERPDPTVIVSSFYIGKYDITQGQWEAVMGNNPSHFNGCDDCPVETVSWLDAQEFISKLNQLSGKHFRLPTNAEWEYAAKDGAKNKGYRYAGSNDVDAVAWYYDDYGNNSTHPVGQKQPNGLGLYDMNGNVFQWCNDWYDVDYLAKLYSSTDPAVNPQGPSAPMVSNVTDPEGPVNGTFRVIRGEAWWLPKCYVSVTMCLGDPPDYRWADVGFRLVLTD